MSDILLNFNAMPSVVSTYPRSFLANKPTLVPTGKKVPAIEANIDNVSALPQKITAYNEVCGFPDSDNLPITYPHVLAMPLHLQMLTHDAFPVRILGLIHIANKITRYGPIPIQEILGIRCFIEGHQDTVKGHIFELNTVVTARGSVVWEEVCTFLAKKPSGSQSGKERKKPTDAASAFNRPGAKSSGWQAPAEIGRRYARVSGDFNPIHLSALSARLFGFPKAIAHGMWSLARSLAEIGDDTLGHSVQVENTFKLPVLLPAWVTFLTIAGDDGISFRLTDGAGQKPHLSGTCRRIPLRQGCSTTKGAPVKSDRASGASYCL
jgi:hypothetical protein